MRIRVKHMNTLLKIENLRTSFFTDSGEIKAVNGVSFSLERGETLGIVGESGCGKTVTALSIMQLLNRNAKITEGSILYKGKELLNLSQNEMCQIRGKEIAMIFQEPMTALNPVFTIGEQIRETVRLHRKVGKKEATDEAVRLLAEVGIAEPRQRIADYPHQLSGGMRQRAMIAMSLASNPGLLIADEPTTALDVTIQAQILDLLSNLQKEKGLGLMLITHDLGVVAEYVDWVAIMYAGTIMEYARTADLFNEPLHPYTKALLDCLPKEETRGKRLGTLKGYVPVPGELANGCSFYERCQQSGSECNKMRPELVEIKQGHWVACVKCST